MSKAALAPPGEDGLFIGRFPDMPEVPPATDADAAECLKKLRRNFEEWMLFRVARHLSLPDIEGSSISYQETRSRPALIERLHRLESELQELVGEAERPSAPHPFRRRLAAAVKTANEYWALFSFAGALIAVIIILMRFGVGPFEEYRKIQINREVSEVYTRMGDKLLKRGEYELAMTQYKAALAVHPNNLAALEGTFKSQALDPVEGERYVRKGILSARLESLKTFPGSDYLIDFYTGVAERDESHFGKAKAALLAAVQKNPDLARAHVELGGIALEDEKNFDIKQAMEEFARADEIGAHDIVNHGEISKYFLGYSRMLLGDFRQAAKDLKDSMAISPRVDTAYSLGEVLRYQGDSENALSQHLYAASILADDKNADEDFLSERTLCHFAPEYPGDPKVISRRENPDDREGVSRYDVAYGFKDFRILIHYALSLDYVLDGDFENADAMFKSGHDLDEKREFDAYMKNRVDSMLAFLDSAGFHDAAFKDPTRLAGKLRRGSDPASGLVRKRLSPATLRLLESFDGHDDAPLPLRYALINDFNVLLDDATLADDFYRQFNDPAASIAKVFFQDMLTKETVGLLDRRPRGKDLRRLNWALLADSYPGEIVKRLNDEQRKWLEKRSKSFTL